MVDPVKFVSIFIGVSFTLDRRDYGASAPLVGDTVALTHTPHSTNTRRTFRIAGNTSWFRSSPCASKAACSSSQIHLSSLKMPLVNQTMAGQAASISHGYFAGRFTMIMPNVSPAFRSRSTAMSHIRA